MLFVLLLLSKALSTLFRQNIVSENIIMIKNRDYSREVEKEIQSQEDKNPVFPQMSVHSPL